MTFYGSEYSAIINYCSKMPIVWKLPTSQCAKTIPVLKELFAKYWIPEGIQSDNVSQFASHLFAEFIKDWNIKHSTSSPRNHGSNGKAESAVKICYRIAYPCQVLWTGSLPGFISIQVYPSWSHLWSPAEMLYQYAICTTVPQRIKHKDPHVAELTMTTGCCKKPHYMQDKLFL